MANLLEILPRHCGMHEREDAVNVNQSLTGALRIAFNMVPDAILFVDAFDFQVIDANVAACDIVGLPKQQLMGNSLVNLLPGFAAQADALDEVLRREKLETTIAVDTQPGCDRNGLQRLDIRWADSDDSNILIVMARPVDGRGGSSEDAPVPCDALTGLPNRDWWLQQVRIALSRARQDSRRCAVLFIDLDDFKQVNDRYGHRAGDTVLKTVAKRLSACMRPQDVISRYGGDEFVALIREVSAATAIQQVRSRIEETFRQPICFGEATVTITGAIGASCSNRSNTKPETLIDAADRAMYRAKFRRRRRSLSSTSNSINDESSPRM